MKFLKLKYCIFLFFAVSLNSTSASAITYSDSLVATNYYKGAKNRILVTPFSVLDRNSPAVQFGFERKVSSRIGIQVTAAYIIKREFFVFMDNLAEEEKGRLPNHKGFKLRAESKYHFKNKFYCGLEIFYVDHYVSDAVVNQSRTNLNQQHHIDYFDVEKKKIGINTKFGRELYLSDK